MQAGGGPKLTDVLVFVAMQGQEDIVARFGLGLDRSTWSDPDLWRPCINVFFRKKYQYFDNRFTRLMAYIQHDRLDLVKKALSYGADPKLNTTEVREKKKYTIRTPLQCAIEQNNLCLAALMLEHGVDPNQAFFETLNRKQTPLELASEKDNFSIVRLLVDEYSVKVPGAFALCDTVPHDKISKCELLVTAIRNSNLPLAQFLVGKGVRVNYPDPGIFYWDELEKKWKRRDDATAHEIFDGDLVSFIEVELESPVAQTCLAMVSFLLDAGAVMNFLIRSSGRLRGRESPLLTAVKGERMDLVTLLLEIPT